MDGETIFWIVVAVVVAVAALIGVAALWEFNRERALQCSRCGRSGPFPEREMMALRQGRPTHCPDCGTQLDRRGTDRSGQRPYYD